MMQLIEYCRTHNNIDDILALPDVKERVDLFKSHAEKSRSQIERCARVNKNLVVLDLRDEDTIYASNRFMIYALFQQCNILRHVMWGKSTEYGTGYREIHPE